jgi:hypothetical protein
MQGQGIFYFVNGDQYVGDFKQDKMHGQGTFYYANMEKYEGDLKNGNRHGQGTFFYDNGDKYLGEQKNNKFKILDFSSKKYKKPVIGNKFIVIFLLFSF